MSEIEKQLTNLTLAPWIIQATALRCKRRLVGGNMFYHQMATLSVLLHFGHIKNYILLKASCIHDLIEDIPETNQAYLRTMDADANDVVDLVLEVTRRQFESKTEFLQRILETGSENALLLKTADRISNLIETNSDIYNREKIKRYLEETEAYVVPMAKKVDQNMLTELIELILSRKKIISKK